MGTMSVKQCEKLYAAADAAGKAAADAVQLNPCVFSETDVFGNKLPGKPVYSIPDACGFAWVNIKPGNIKFAKWMVASGMAKKDSYNGGVRYPVFEFGQMISKKEAYAYAFAETLREAGIKRVYADSRLD